ncbi:MAG: terpene cyclase/mutase family protein [bacterium]|nr:terpene cyclase/mutase family protein [bacterium]
MNEVLAWLAEPADPAVRYRTLADLLGDPNAAGARDDLLRSLAVTRLRHSQAADGSWHGPGYYVPKHRATFFVLLLLADWGLDRTQSWVERAAEFALAFQGPEGEFYQMRRPAGRRRPGRWPVPCVTARSAWALARLGYAGDSRVLGSAGWLESLQRPDGAWSCEGVAGPPGYRSARGCLGCAIWSLAALGEIPAFRGGSAHRRAAGFVLGRLGLPAAGYHMETLWDVFTYPRYAYDAGMAVEALLAAGEPAGDHRLRQAIDRLAGRRRADGRWILDRVPRRPPVNPGRRGRPSKWATFYALRALGQGRGGGAGAVPGGTASARRVSPG